jgi:Fic family protein
MIEESYAIDNIALGMDGGLLQQVNRDKARAANFISITGTSRATATRDLQELVGTGALTQTGTLKSTRYYLNFSAR